MNLPVFPGCTSLHIQRLLKGLCQLWQVNRISGSMSLYLGFLFASSCGFEETMLLSSSISPCRSTRSSYLFSFHHLVIKIEYNIEMNLFYRFLGSLSVLLKHFLLSGKVNILIDKFRFSVT